MALSVSSMLTLAIPIRSVKGLVSPTPIPMADSMSMDADRIATLVAATGTVTVYDIASGVLVPFPIPPGTIFATGPQLYGNKVVLASSPSVIAPSTLFYCVLPVPLGPCGPWIPLVAGLPPFPSFSTWGFPVFRGDIAAWAVANGLNYFSFHSGVTTAIPTPGVQPVGLSTNGDIISFVAGGTLQYVRTTDCIGPCVPPITPTGLPAAASATSISQDVIVFNEPGAPSLVRYMNVLSGVASPAGSGPIGRLGIGGDNSPAIWGDRIAFLVSEANLAFDCNGDGVISATDQCVRYWNFRNPVALLVPMAAPPFAPGIGAARPFAIYNRYIAYLGPGGVKYVTVPMIGDTNYDGVVNILDLSAAAFCFGLTIKNTVPPC